MRKRILVTGAGGLAGPYLIKELLKNQEYEVYASVYSAHTNLKGVLSIDHIIAGDLTDYDFATSLIKTTRPDIIYHLAALSVVQTSEGQAVKVMNSNTTISYNLLEAVRLHAPSSRFMAICSANEYGLVKESDLPISELTPLRPLNPYAVSKITQEMLALQYHYAYNLDVVILRPFNHTGPGQTTDFIIPKLAKQFVGIAGGEVEPVLELGNTETIRDYTDVEDMARAYVLAGEKCQTGEIYNIGSGHGVKVEGLIEMFSKIAGVEVKVKTAGSLVRTADVPVLIADPSKFVKATGWKPEIALLQTLTNVYNYWKGEL